MKGSSSEIEAVMAERTSSQREAVPRVSVDSLVAERQIERIPILKVPSRTGSRAAAHPNRRPDARRWMWRAPNLR